MTVESDFFMMSVQLNRYHYTNKFIIGVRRALLTHWQKLGLLKDRRNNHETWAKYSLTEILWMSIIQELRGLGLSNASLVKVCDYAFSSESDLSIAFTKAETATNLSVTIIEILQKQTTVLLMVKKSGESAFKTLDKYKQMLSSEPISNHLIINVNDCVASNIKWLYESPDISWATGLSRDEVQAILILKGNNFKTFILIKKDETIGNETANETADLLKKQEYKHLEIALKDNSVFGVARKKRTRTPKKKSQKQTRIVT